MGIGPREDPLNFGMDSNKLLELGRDMRSTECYSGSNLLKYVCISFSMTNQQTSVYQMRCVDVQKTNLI